MKNYFDISEFIIDPNATTVPIHVVQKIDTHHKPILNYVRHKRGVPLFVSQASGYRSVDWEKKRGRSGNSQHCFGENKPEDELMMHWGAVDLREDNDMEALLNLLLNSAYNRVCYYPDSGFIHCDFKGERYYYFEQTAKDSSWQFKYERMA